MESITKIIGERIRAYRNKKKWSQEELASVIEATYESALKLATAK